MYTRRIFPIGFVLKFTRWNILKFILLSAVPVILFEVFKMKWLHVPWLPIGVLGTAVAFIVGFKNNASYDRLWEARKIWGGIVNASRSWTVMIKDFITNDFAKQRISEEELKSIHKELVYRHIAWLTALRYQLRTKRPWEKHLRTSRSKIEFRDFLYKVPEETYPIKDVITPYLSEEELNEVFAKGNWASQILGKQSMRLRELYRKGFIENFRHMEMANIIVEFYTLQGKCERIKNFPYPRQFATLNYIFVWVFILLIPFGIMEEFEGIGESIMIAVKENPANLNFFQRIQLLIGDHFVWFSVPFSALLAWVFHTMEAIGENTENPFQGGPNDVPITDLSRSIEIDIRQLIDDHNLPEPYTWKNDIIL